MNKVILIGRLTKDPDVRYTQGQQGDSAVARFTIAVDRRRAGADGQREADFISCVAFGKQAEFLQKYFTKGMKIGLTGRIQTGSYTNKDNVKVYTTDVVAEDVEFVESRSSQGGAGYQPSYQPQGGYQQGGYAPQGGYQNNFGGASYQQMPQAQGGFGQDAFGGFQAQQKAPEMPRQEMSDVGRGFMNVDGFEDDSLPFGD